VLGLLAETDWEIMTLSDSKEFSSAIGLFEKLQYTSGMDMPIRGCHYY